MVSKHFGVPELVALLQRMTQFEQSAFLLHFVKLQKAKHLVLDFLLVRKQVFEFIFVLKVIPLFGQIVLADRD